MALKVKKQHWSLPVMLRSKRDKQLRVMALNVNGMTGESNRKELVEKKKRKKRWICWGLGKGIFLGRV